MAGWERTLLEVFLRGQSDGVGEGERVARGRERERSLPTRTSATAPQAQPNRQGRRVALCRRTATRLLCEVPTRTHPPYRDCIDYSLLF